MRWNWNRPKPPDPAPYAKVTARPLWGAFSFWASRSSSVEVTGQQGAVDLCSDQFAHIARDPFAKLTLQFRPQGLADDFMQRSFVKDIEGRAIRIQKVGSDPRRFTTRNGRILSLIQGGNVGSDALGCRFMLTRFRPGCFRPGCFWPV